VEFMELDERRGGGGEELMTEGCEGEGGDAELWGGVSSVEGDLEVEREEQLRKRGGVGK
jgi:hypothetical protein